MQYMIVGTLKDSASPSDSVTLGKKFQSWQPPDGLQVDGLWNSGARAYALFSTDDYTLVGEVIAQYQAVFNFTIDPVVPAEDMAPAMLRGSEWAAS